MKKYRKEIRNILAEFSIKNGEDYLNKEEDDLAVIYENLKIVQEEYGLSDEDFEDEEERAGYIKSYQEDSDTFIEMENRIKNENYKPVVKLNIYPEYGCYLADCIRHSF